MSSTTEFSSDLDFREYLETIFKEPGKYGFSEVALKFNEQARVFNDQGFYCNAPFRSKDFTAYWEDQKNKCRDGVLYHGKQNVFYLTRDYYMWLNFLPIFDKEEKKYGLKAKELVETFMPVGSIQTLITEKDKSGKFGRILGKFRVHEPHLDRYVILNDFMVDNHYAVEYNGQSKQEIAEEHLKNRDKLSKVMDGINMIRNDNRNDHMNRDNGSS